MKRRNFIALLGGAATLPFAARAQQSERMRLVGMLKAYPKSDPLAKSELAAFVEAFQGLGWIDGRNVMVEFRWADGGFDQMQSFAKELVALKPT